MFSMFLIISVIISSIGLISLPASTFSYLTNLTNNGTPTTQQLFLQTNFGLTFITFIVYSVQVSGFTILVSQMFTTRMFENSLLFYSLFKLNNLK